MHEEGIVGLRGVDVRDAPAVNENLRGSAEAGHREAFGFRLFGVCEGRMAERHGSEKGPREARKSMDHEMNLPTRITAQALLGLMLIAAQVARADNCESARRDLDARISEAASEDPRHDRFRGSRWLRQSPFLHAELLAASDDAAKIRAVLDAMANLDRSALALELGKNARDIPSPDCWKEAVDLLLSTPDALTGLRSVNLPITTGAGPGRSARTR